MSIESSAKGIIIPGIEARIPPSFTVGIEEEYMVIDPLTFDLKSCCYMSM